MTQHLWFRQRVFMIRAALVALATCVIVAALPRFAPAAPLADQVHSLKMVPADSAFYTSSLRLKEQWDAFLDSNAYNKLMQIQLIQLVKMQASFYFQQSEEPAVAKVREYLQSAAGQDATAVLQEMFAEEVYLYGGSDIFEWFKLLGEMNAMQRSARVKAQAEGEDSKAASEEFLKNISDRISSGMSIPTVVAGFRIKDGERANRELNEVHSLLRNLLDEQQPDLAAHLQREQFAGHEFLTLRLDGSMIPWDKIREEEGDKIDDEQFDKIREAVSKHKLTVAVGVVNEFVLVSVGETSDHLEKVGQGQSIADLPAIKRLEKHADQRLVSVAYTSKEFAKSMGSPQKTIDDIASGIEEALVEGEVSEEDRKVILDDIRSLNIAKYMPEPADSSGVMFLTPRGYEGFQYSDAKRPLMDSSKPLTILSHAGGNPLLVVASRSKENIADYEEAVAWLKKIAVDVEKIAKEKADEDDWAKYEKIRDRGIALLTRFDQATREHLFPALTDGQSAFVMDLTAKSKQWFNKMPESPKPLPILEMAFVTGVNDAEKLRLGVKEYIDIAREAYDLLKEVDTGDDVPNVELPEAKVSELADGGKLFSYPLPEKWGVDEQVAVNAGLTDALAVVSLMPGTTERLLRATPPKIDTALPLDRPAALVAHVEVAKMIDATRPWIDYGVDIALGKLKPPKKDGDESDDSDEEKPAQQSPLMLQMGLVVPQIQQLLDVATVFRSVSSITYEEDGVWTTHSETHIEDVK